MKQRYFKRIYICLGLFAALLSSCSEAEDMVSPREETCGTMATVQYQQESGLSLVLENGQVLQPENVKKLAANGQVFAIDGFAVKTGQQILIGFQPLQGQSGKSTTQAVKVNCIVGLSPQ
ncbi:MAG: hypothetical protein ACO1O1_16205 [Adhaeribacter sp.]